MYKYNIADASFSEIGDEYKRTQIVKTLTDRDQTSVDVLLQHLFFFCIRPDLSKKICKVNE